MQPDVIVPAEKAPLTAQIMTIKGIIKRDPTEKEKIAALKKVIAQKEQELNNMK